MVVTGLDVSSLRCLLALAEELNFTRAASRCAISQQSLSATVARVETEIGVRLFDRTTHRVTVTPAGRTLLVGVRSALDTLDTAITAARREASVRPIPLRVSCIIDAQVVLAERISSFLADRADIDVTLTFGRQPDVLAELKSGGADLALLWNLGPEAGLPHSRVLGRERLVAVLPTGHTLAARDSVRPEELGREPLVLFERRFAPAVYDAFVRQLRSTNQIVTAPVIDSSHRARVEAAARGLGVTAVTAGAVDRLDLTGVVVRPIEPPAELELTAAWHRNTPEATAFVDHLHRDPNLA